jgi:hypothetical protein
VEDVIVGVAATGIGVGGLLFAGAVSIFFLWFGILSLQLTVGLISRGPFSAVLTVDIPYPIPVRRQRQWESQAFELSHAFRPC